MALAGPTISDDYNLSPLALDDVVDLKRLWLARIDPYVRENGHKALAECAELLLRVPYLADSHLPIREKAHMEFQPVRWEIPGVLETADRLVVLVGARRTGGREAN
jgi:plasmid stabilization system protein ParE